MEAIDIFTHLLRTHTHLRRNRSSHASQGYCKLRPLTHSSGFDVVAEIPECPVKCHEAIFRHETVSVGLHAQFLPTEILIISNDIELFMNKECMVSYIWFQKVSRTMDDLHSKRHLEIIRTSLFRLAQS